jgi:hypothetical protein
LKAELENLKLENIKLAALIEAQSRAETGRDAANGEEISSLRLQDRELEMQLSKHHAGTEASSLSQGDARQSGTGNAGAERAVQQPVTPLEQWVAMLPVNGVLASCFPVLSGPEDQALRSVGKLSDDEIHATVDVFSRKLLCLLLKARTNLQQMFSRADQKAAEAAKGSGGAVEKFDTFKMKTGTVADYVDGISGRVGKYLCLKHCYCIMIVNHSRNRPIIGVSNS